MYISAHSAITHCLPANNTTAHQQSPNSGCPPGNSPQLYSLPYEVTW